MNIDVAKAIKELLFDHEAVILPGLGGFTSTPIASAVDYVQGTVQPPTRKLEFNTNLIINDGVLVHHIQQGEVVTAQDAILSIENYVEIIKEALDQREIVDIPHVGRLYKDYEQKIRFMPDGSNFEVESFGLPSVKFSPVVRHKTPTETVAPPFATIKNKTKDTFKPAATDGSSWAEKVLPTLIILAAVLLAVSLFVWLRGCSSSPQGEVPQERVNVKPNQENLAKTEENATADLGNADEMESGNNGIVNPPTDEQKNETTQENKAEQQDVTPTPATKHIFIVVHSFGSKDNARKFAQDLKRSGFEPTTKLHGGLNRVGVEVSTARENEIESLIQELGSKFKSTPVVVDY